MKGGIDMDQDRMMMARLIKGTTQGGAEIVVGMYHNMPDIIVDGERVGICSYSYQYVTNDEQSGINMLTATVVMNDRRPHVLLVDFNQHTARID